MLCFNEKERGKLWRDDMEMTMNGENCWDHNVEEYSVEGPIR